MAPSFLMFIFQVGQKSKQQNGTLCIEKVKLTWGCPKKLKSVNIFAIQL